MTKVVVPQGKKQKDFSYKWQCPHFWGKPCSWCFEGDIEKLLTSFKTSRGVNYYAQWKAYLALKGQEIILESKSIKDKKSLSLLTTIKSF